MTYFLIDGVPLTRACNKNSRIMREAKKIYFTSGIEEATKFVKENTKKELRVKKIHNKKEDLKARRKALGVSGTFMARAMGYSKSFYIAAEAGTERYSESFYDRFVKSEKKIKKLFNIK